MKILTILTLTAELLSPFSNKPIKMDRVLNNSTYPHASISYSYFVSGVSEYWDNTTSADHGDTVPQYFYVDINVNFDELCSCEFRVYHTVAGDNYVPEYLVTGGRVLTSNKEYTVINVDNSNCFNIKYIFSYDVLLNSYTYQDSYSYPDPGNVYSNGTQWTLNGYDFFRLTNFTYSNYISTTDLDDINDSILNVESSIENLQTLQLYDIPEYSWSIYYLFKRKWLLKYDDTFPKPYVTTTNDSATTFSWDDAIQIQDRDLYIVLATFGASSSTLPVKIIKSNNTDVSSDFTWTYRYTGRYRFYYARIPESLFNNALNIKWTAAVNVMPVYLGRLRNMPFEVSEICNIDSNNQIVRILNDLKTAINNINVTNNTTVTEINNNITEYNTTIQNVFNVENNLSTSLDQSMQLYSPDNTNVLQRLNDSSTLLKSVINQVNGIEIFTIPLGVALVGIVLIAIVG